MLNNRTKIEEFESLINFGITSRVFGQKLLKKLKEPVSEENSETVLQFLAGTEIPNSTIQRHLKTIHEMKKKKMLISGTKLLDLEGNKKKSLTASANRLVEEEQRGILRRTSTAKSLTGNTVRRPTFEDIKKSIIDFKEQKQADLQKI